MLDGRTPSLALRPVASPPGDEPQRQQAEGGQDEGGGLGDDDRCFADQVDQEFARGQDAVLESYFIDESIKSKPAVALQGQR